MPDADVDGDHIAALLLRMFVMYFPFLIEAGMVYRAVAPLYSIKEGKKKKYFTENVDFVKYIQKLFINDNDLKNINNKPLSNNDITRLLLNNIEYVYFLEKISNTYAVDPYLLEMVLNHYVKHNESIKYDELNKEISSKYRFMRVEKSKGTIVVKGTIDKSNLIIMNDKFLTQCEHILELIKSNDSMYYLLNNKKASIYTIMLAYKAAEPSNIQRYKGLGEMDKEELAESALHPAMDRTLIRYTMDDAKEAINIIREYESNTKKILELVGVVTRDDLLD